MFNPGDRVICIKGKKLSTFSKNLEEGLVCTVEKSWSDGWENFVNVKEFPGLNLYAERFELVKEEGYTPVIAKIRQMHLRQQLRKAHYETYWEV